ncbi:glycosyltransferase family 4 protein [Polycladomyces sp. WAk]|uniref:Glycosyltransferase family 4 protein n=1 Tax=Polycladomyces zharkentensis TaxID=2807616 RepID=A0ABS2WER2_9BACL|nr:glycosyltransferase family 4 protein [Polycladomyces sp. WAk]MBN2908023.1 glycosyltransferase family 4 protein [Polycladomyces sp. WAk]
MLKVLVISHMYPNPANPMSGIFVHNQVKALAAAGVECRVVSPVPRFPLYPKWKAYREFPKRTVMDGIIIDYVPTWMFPGGFFFGAYGMLYYWSLSRHLTALRREFPFDLIHCHTIYPDGHAGGKLKSLFNVPVVSTIHGSDIRLYPKRSRWVYRNTEEALRLSDHIITVSDRLRKEALQMVAGIEAVTIYNGFDPTRFYPRNQKEVRQQLGLDEQYKIALFVGNFYPVKGLSHLLTAFAQLVEKDPSVRLVMVGDGPLKSQLQRQCREAGIQDHVLFQGRRPHDEIPLWINASDVVVLSSLSEGLPSILLESMGCGKPFVATDVGGIAEILQHRKTGFLVKPEDADELARYLSILLIEEEGLARDMGERAYTLSGSLTWKENADRVKRLYEQMLDQQVDTSP